LSFSSFIRRNVWATTDVAVCSGNISIFKTRNLLDRAEKAEMIVGFKPHAVLISD
jgi:hypothetical protein